MIKKLCALSTTLAVLCSPIAHADQDLLIGSTAASSSHYGYFVAVSKLINGSVPGVSSSVAETGATLDNLRRLTRHQIDIGLVTTNSLHEAYNGADGFKDRPVHSKLLWIYALAPQNVAVRSDAGVNDLQQLAGKPFNPGIRGSSTEATSERVLQLLGIAPDFVRGSTSDVVNAIKDNRMIGYVKSGAGLKPDASTRDIATQTPLTILGLSEDQAASVKAQLPQLSIFKVPAIADMNIPDYMTWGFGVGASASDQLDEDVAYSIVKAVMEDKEQQAAAMAGLKDQNLAEMTLAYATSPLHPATIRYLTEQGYDVPANLIDN